MKVFPIKVIKTLSLNEFNNKCGKNELLLRNTECHIRRHKKC